MELLTTPKLKISNSVAVVFSAPCIEDYYWGQIIDKFTDVVRFNAFRLGHEYEMYVGTKTTIWATYDMNYNKNWLHPENHAVFDQLCRIYQNMPKINCSGEATAPRQFKGYSLSKQLLVEIKKTVENPSAGFQIISLLVASGVRPHLFGFERKASETYRNYYSDRIHTNSAAVHNWRKEKEEIARLEKNGLITIY